METDIGACNLSAIVSANVLSFAGKCSTRGIVREWSISHVYRANA